MAWPPERILCLTEDGAETLHLLGQAHRIVAATPYAVRPPGLSARVPTIAGFGDDDLRAALAMMPDLAVVSADLQADFGAALAREGVPVHLSTPRDLAGALDGLRALGALVGAPDRAAALTGGYEDRIAAMRADPPPRRPRVWAEQWDSPLMAAPAWASELIEAAGGEDVALHLRAARGAVDLIVDPEEIAAMRPDLVIASWRGKRVRPARILGRPGWALTPAGRAEMIVEIPAPLLLVPGPGMLDEGLTAIRAAVEAAATLNPNAAPEPSRAAPPPLSRPPAREG